MVYGMIYSQSFTPPKAESCHDDDFVVSGDTVGFRYDDR